MHHRSFTYLVLKGWLIATLISFVSADDHNFAIEELTEGSLGGAIFEHRINMRDPNANGEDTLTVRYTVPQTSWVAVGVNPTGGGMVNGEVVIAKPDDGTIKKYRMTGRNGNAITELPNQTLINPSLEQVDGKTILTFTKLLAEEDEYIITMMIRNTFIFAFGSSNSFAFHQGYGVQNVVLNNIVVPVPVIAPVPAPTVAPVVAPTEAPVAAPTEAPVVAPTEAPVPAPTEAPMAAPTEAPVAAPTEAPVAAPTEAPVAAPTEAPVAAPTEAPVAPPSEVPAPATEDGFVRVPFGGAVSDLNFGYKLNRNDANADGADTVSIKMSCPGNVWVGVGASRLGSMTPSKSVIGFPGGDAPPMQYFMERRELSGVNPLPDDQQVLIDPSIVFENDETTLSYTIPIFVDGSGMDEDLEIHADGENQNLIYACGSEAGPSFHQKYGSLSTVIGEGDDVPAPVPVPATPAPAALNFREVRMTGKLEPSTFRYAVTRNDPKADGEDTITVEFSSPGEVWLGTGVSQYGGMVPGKAVIGFPGGDSPPALYNLGGKAIEFVTPLPDEEQNLIDPQITVSDGVTTLRFTQPLGEADDPFAIKADGETMTNFIGAHGLEAGPSFHVGYGSFSEIIEDTEPATEVGFREVPLTGSLEPADFKYRLNRNDVAAGGADTITIEYSCPGNIWVGVGVSEFGAMVPSKSVIGFPGADNPPAEFFMQAKEVPGVNPLPEEEQSLIDPQISFANDRTTMRYTIPVFPSGATTTANAAAEALQIHADGRSNNFIGACGTSAGPSFHQRYGTFPVVVEEGETEAPATAAPFAAPIAPRGFEVLELTGDLEGSTLSYQINPDDPNTGNKDSITVSYTAPTTGWVAVGPSESGAMVGSEAVIGIPATGEVKKYTLSSKEGDLSGVQPMPEDKQTLVNTDISQANGMTTLTYTKILVEDGEIPINRVGENVFIAAQGASNTLGFHSARGAFTLSGKEIERDNTLWAVHGWLAAIAWGLFCPLAILAGLFRKGIPGEGTWFKIHRTLQSLVVLLTIISVIVAIAALNKETPSNSSADHFSPSLVDGHRLIGLFVLIFAIFQGANGAKRPHLPPKPEENAGGDDEEGKGSSTPSEPAEKSDARKAWEVLHRLLGVGLLALTWYQVHLGIFWYGEFFNGGDTGMASTAFYVIIGFLGVLILLGALMRILMG